VRSNPFALVGSQSVLGSGAAGVPAFPVHIMQRPSFVTILTLSTMTLAAGVLNSAAQVVEAQTAEALLQRMEATYAGARSYSDTIFVRFRNPDGAEGARAECRFWFARPGLFRLDGESRRAEDAPPKREVMWSDGESARSWATASAVTLRGKIQLAGSKMFGTYAYHIPTLLERSYGGPRRLHELSVPVLGEEESFEGVNCYRIRGSWQGDPYEIWIGKDDFLVRKITASYSGYAMEEIHREIKLNQDIPKVVFQFAPENEAGTRRRR